MGMIGSLLRCSNMQISLFGSEISLLPKIISLLIFVGKLLGNRCGTGGFRTDIASKSPEIAKFPVNFPVSRELQAETGLHMTAHTTIQSSRTAQTVVDREEAVSAGILPPIFNVSGLCRQ
jgi:hypothetical protein